MDYEERIKRYKRIMLMRKDRWRLREIGGYFGLTRQRIFKIIKDGEPKKSEGGDKSGERKGGGAKIGFFRLNGLPQFQDLSGRERTRMMVRVRDKFTCQNCGAVRTWRDCDGKKLRLFDVHHLNGLCGKKSRGYDKISELDGLITLCHRCHFNHPEHSSRKNNPLQKIYYEDIKSNSSKLVKDSEWFQKLKMRGL